MAGEASSGGSLPAAFLRRWRLPLLAVALAAPIGLAAFAWHDRAQAAAILAHRPEDVAADPALRARALAIARPLFAARCAGCHGDRGQGRQDIGAPDLGDAEWLYGAGKASEIERTIRFGIRAGTGQSWNLADMPAYASARPYANEPIPPLTPAEIADVTEFVLGLTGRQTDGKAAQRGQRIYLDKGGCFDCHGGEAEGDPAIGAPNLADDVWLYGGSRAAIRRSVAGGRAAMMPGFDQSLTPLEVRSLAVVIAVGAERKSDAR